MEIATDVAILSVRISAERFPALRTSASTLCAYHYTGHPLCFSFHVGDDGLHHAPGTVGDERRRHFAEKSPTDRILVPHGHVGVIARPLHAPSPVHLLQRQRKVGRLGVKLECEDAAGGERSFLGASAPRVGPQSARRGPCLVA